MSYRRDQEPSRATGLHEFNLSNQVVSDGLQRMASDLTLALNGITAQ
ncbi:hypothetical protein [Streptomyces sp. MK7]|nr:hypothetical protein [Streptomyces sp. MK7]